MRDFARLFTAVDQSTKTTVKVAALAEFFRAADDADKLWCVALFSGRRPRRVITTTTLREWAAERAGIPLWLFEESYPVVGDLAETISLVLPPPTRQDDRPLHHWIARLAVLSKAGEPERKAGILAAWDSMDRTERLLFTKLLTGGFRVGVSQKLMTRALSQATGRDEAELTHRLMGAWTPETVSWQSLIEAPDPTADLSRPYPFYLAYQREESDDLGPASDWFAERKWDGIRGQLVLRGGGHHLWSRGEELMTDRFPEFRVPPATGSARSPVIDGEVLAFRRQRPCPSTPCRKRHRPQDRAKEALSGKACHPDGLRPCWKSTPQPTSARCHIYTERRAAPRPGASAATSARERRSGCRPNVSGGPLGDALAATRAESRILLRGADAEAAEPRPILQEPGKGRTGGNGRSIR